MNDNSARSRSSFVLALKVLKSKVIDSSACVFIPHTKIVYTYINECIIDMYISFNIFNINFFVEKKFYNVASGSPEMPPERENGRQIHDTSNIYMKNVYKTQCQHTMSIVSYDARTSPLVVTCIRGVLECFWQQFPEHHAQHGACCEAESDRQQCNECVHKQIRWNGHQRLRKRFFLLSIFIYLFIYLKETNLQKRHDSLLSNLW